MRRYIERSMPWPAGEARIELPGLLPDVSCLEERGLRMEIERSGVGEYVGGVPIMVRLADRKGQRRSFVVHARIEVARNVVVAGGTLQGNRTLVADDVRIEKKWVWRIDPKLLNSPDQVEGKRLMVSVPAGGEITTYMLQEPKLVKRGKVVRLQLDRGGIQISTLGICEEDGVMDALVRIKNMSSNRIVYAKVKGENHVVIDF
ncbi:MAG: flagellar basal body P-ring formation chaperone FlgA [Pseudomonadota bacterium]|nr:flagellar basal body P-ring formation chaperone FlgA [Pseudomonadota bacterium]